MYEEPSVTRRTALPLVAVAATFVLPMTDSCDHAVSPLTYIAEADVASAVWVLPTFVAALVLAAAIFRSWRTKAKTALAFVATGALALTLPVLAVLFATGGSHFVAPALYGLATIVTALLLWRARGKAGWRRLSALLDAYAVAAMPLAVVIASLAKYSGAYLFVVAYVAFATQRVLVFLQQRPARSLARVRVAVPTRVADDARTEMELAEAEEEAASALASSD